MDSNKALEAVGLRELLSIAIEAAESASKTLLTRFRPHVGAPWSFTIRALGIWLPTLTWQLTER